ncbi:peptidase inhibitor family I36 protein [Nocardia carnea]|uniref:peptidase inhibitor family I36 protein n=1 Tax=Nocardia carnea TaxID=37328 RepID=UPI002453F5ED|nr:peptidase inhibitor family I36 protein [Nocardia carnea]
MRKFVAAVLLVLGTAGLSGLAAPAPAHAATGFDRCPDGHFCIFSAPDGGGKIAYFRLGSTDLRLQGVDGQVYSIWNRTGQAWQGFTQYNYTGGVIFLVQPGHRSNVPADVAVQVHSVKAA